MNEVLINDMPLHYRDYIKKRGLGKIIDVSKFEKIISVLLRTNYDSIDKLHSIGKIAEKGEKNAKNVEGVVNVEEIAVAGGKVWVCENENLYRNLTNYINLFNMNNNMVPIKDVFFLNETLNNVALPRSMTYLAAGCW